MSLYARDYQPGDLVRFEEAWVDEAGNCIPIGAQARVLSWFGFQQIRLEIVDTSTLNAQSNLPGTGFVRLGDSIGPFSCVASVAKITRASESCRLS